MSRGWLLRWTLRMLGALALLGAACAPPDRTFEEDTPPHGAAPMLAAPDASPSWEISLTGSAANAKAGAVLLLGPAEIPIYMSELELWPSGLFGQTVTVEGRLERGSFLSEGGVDANGNHLQGVRPGGQQWRLTGVHVVERAAAPSAVPLELAEAAWPELRSCIASTRSALLASGEPPEQFHVNLPVGVANGEARLGLWHASAFAPEHRNLTGNPGGRSRDARCEVASGSFGGFLFWQ